MQKFDESIAPWPPLRRAISLGLYFTLMAGASLISFALEAAPDQTKRLVYISDSDNKALNQRIRPLLKAAFDEAVVFRTYESGQILPDTEAPVIAIGPAAFARVRQDNYQQPLLGLLVDGPFVAQNVDQTDHAKTSAVLFRPRLLVQAAIGKAILPYATRVAMLARPDTEHLYRDLLNELSGLGMKGRVFLVSSDEQLISTLIRALSYGDFLLAAPDSSIYNPRTIKHILLTAYRRNRILIGPSQAYVKAGSLASAFTPLDKMAEMVADFTRQFWAKGEFPEPAYPAKFGIEINRQVGRSLNIPLPERQTLIESVVERLNGAGVQEHE